MLVEQTMYQIMVVMVTTFLIPALTYAVQVDIPKVRSQYHKLHSPLIQHESDVDLHSSKKLDDAFDKAHIVSADDRIRAPSTAGTDSRHKHGLEERLRRIHNRNHQHREHKNNKKYHEKHRTLISPKNEDKHHHKLLEDHERINEKDDKRIRHQDKGHNQRNKNNHHEGTKAHQTPHSRKSTLTSSRRNEDVADLHPRRSRREGPEVPLLPPIPTNMPPPNLGHLPPLKVQPEIRLARQTTRMPITTSSTNQSGDGNGSAVSHLYGANRWTMALATLLCILINILF